MKLHPIVSTFLTEHGNPLRASWEINIECLRNHLSERGEFATDIKLIPAICPSCGASLQLPDNLTKAHCMYCGTEVLVQRGGSYKVECKVCDGFGRIDVCKACNGTGKCTWYASSSYHGHQDITALMAYGSGSHCVEGICSACEGRGSGSSFSSCPFCGGTGKCPRCLGNAKCTACRGLGVLPGPSGSQTCPGCAGKGYVEEDPPKASVLSRCPECGKSMDNETCFCSRCGYARACPKCGASWPKGSLLCPRCGFRKGGRV